MILSFDTIKDTIIYSELSNETEFFNWAQRLGYGLLRKMSEGLFRCSRKIAKLREFSAENSAAMNYSR